jgi:hypothetical protein
MRSQFPNKAPQPMPGNVKSALDKRSLMDAFRDRPTYQQDDYLKWISTAAGPTMKQQRLDQMLDELEKGGSFKGTPWAAPEKQEPVRTNPPVATGKPAEGERVTPIAKAEGNAGATPSPGKGAKASAAKSAVKPPTKKK